MPGLDGFELTRKLVASDAHPRVVAVSGLSYASYVARTVFLHTLAFDEKLRGLTPEHLRYSVVGPATDVFGLLLRHLDEHAAVPQS